MSNQENAKPMGQVIGIGSLEGWTRADILEEAGICRSVCCSTAYDAHDRERAIETVATLIAGCGDLDLSTGILMSVMSEMQARHSMLCRGIW